MFYFDVEDVAVVCRCPIKLLEILPTLREKIFDGIPFFQGLNTATLSKKRVQNWCFPVIFINFFRTAFCKTTMNEYLQTMIGCLEDKYSKNEKTSSKKPL